MSPVIGKKKKTVPWKILVAALSSILVVGLVLFFVSAPRKTALAFAGETDRSGESSAGTGKPKCVPVGNNCGTRECGDGEDSCGNPISCGACGTFKGCADNARCLPGNLVEDFANCDNAIYIMRGRLGFWYEYHSDTLNPASGMGAHLPVNWNIPDCAAWMTGGTAKKKAADDAGFGFTWNSEKPYDVCKYVGVQVTYSSIHDILMNFHHGNSSSTATVTSTVLPGVPTTATRRVKFPDGTCNRMTNLEFKPTDYRSFGLAVYRISLY